jgi:hypothetical protein
MHPRFRVASARAAIRESDEKTPSLDRIPKKSRRWSMRQFQSQVMKKEDEEDDDVHWMCHSHIKKSISSQIIEKGTYLTLGGLLSPLAPMM